MGKRKKDQIVALVDPDVRVNLDVLRIITRESRARVLEDLVKPALAERMSSTAVRRDVKRIRVLAANAGISFEEYVARYADTYSRQTYGPGIDALEQEASEQA